MTHAGDVIVATGALIALCFAMESLWPWVRSTVQRRRERTSAIRRAATPVDIPSVDDGRSKRREEIQGPKMPVSKAENAEESVEAQRLWDEAQSISHLDTSDFSTNWRYRRLLHRAAKLGHTRAMTALGECAALQGDVVEAYYWMKAAELRGMRGLGRVLLELQSQWIVEGCPDGREESGSTLSEAQREFALAALGIQCKIDPQYARMCLNELSEQGVLEARLLLRRLTGRS